MISTATLPMDVPPLLAAGAAGAYQPLSLLSPPSSFAWA